MSDEKESEFIETRGEAAEYVRFIIDTQKKILGLESIVVFALVARGLERLMSMRRDELLKENPPELAQLDVFEKNIKQVAETMFCSPVIINIESNKSTLLAVCSVTNVVTDCMPLRIEIIGKPEEKKNAN